MVVILGVVDFLMRWLIPQHLQQQQQKQKHQQQQQQQHRQQQQRREPAANERRPRPQNEGRNYCDAPQTGATAFAQTDSFIAQLTKQTK